MERRKYFREECVARHFRNVRFRVGAISLVPTISAVLITVTNPREVNAAIGWWSTSELRFAAHVLLAKGLVRTVPKPKNH